MEGSTKKTKVIIDVDTGVDDAHALILAFRSPALQVVGVTTVCGNMDIEKVTANTLQVLDVAAAPAGVDVAKGCSGPLLEGLHYCPQIHGEDGLLGLAKKSERTVHPMHAVNYLVETLINSPEKLTVILLAPMTNMAMALRLQPKIKDKIEKIVFMGGSAFSGGNSTCWAEANIRDDPEAAQIVLTSGVPLLMFGWDVYLKVMFTPEDVEKLRASHHPWCKFAADLFDIEMKNFNLPFAVYGDAGAVAALINPEGLVTQEIPVRVELQGTYTRGMTVADLRKYVFPPDDPKLENNVSVITDLNADLYKKLFMDTLLN